MIDKSYGLAIEVDGIKFYKGISYAGIVGEVDGRELYISSAVVLTDSRPLGDRVRYEIAKHRSR